MKLLTDASTWLQRGTLDRRLAAGVEPWASPELRRRAVQLTSPHARQRLAATIDRVLAGAQTRGRSGDPAVPLNRDGVELCRRLLAELAADLRAPGSVSSRGVVLIKELVFDGSSPLYAPADERELEGPLRRARAALYLG